jgi:hypothetical protein
MSCSRRGGRRASVKNDYSYVEHLKENESVFVVVENTHGHPRVKNHKKIVFKKDDNGQRNFMVDGERYSATGISKLFLKRSGSTQEFHGPRHLGMCVPRTHPEKGADVVRLRDLTADHKRCSPSQEKALLRSLGAAPAVTIRSPAKTPAKRVVTTRVSSRGMGARTRSKTPRR